VTYLGWLYAWGAPLTLIGEDSAQIAAAKRELVRIVEFTDRIGQDMPLTCTDTVLTCSRRSAWGHFESIW
jgi:hypothetical protein